MLKTMVKPIAASWIFASLTAFRGFALASGVSPSGKLHGPKSKRHRVEQGKGAAHKRILQPVLLADPRLLDRLRLDDDLAIGRSAGHGKIAWRTHHHTFDDRLAAVLEVLTLGHWEQYTGRRRF